MTFLQISIEPGLGHVPFNKPDGTPDCAITGGVTACRQHTYWVKTNSIANLTLQGASVAFSAKTNVYESIGGNKTAVGLDGGGSMQLVFTPAGGQYTYTGSGASTTLTCPSDSNGCASFIVNKSTGGVWFSSAWGPVTVGDLPQTVLKTMVSPGGTVYVH